MKQLLKRRNEIKKVETKGKRLIKSQEKLLGLFDDLKTIFDNNNNNNNNSNDNSNNNNENNSKNENENENEYENENENESEVKYESENENEKDEYYYKIRQLNSWFETIDQTNSLEEQTELLKERGEFLGEYWSVGYYHGNKELNYKIFKTKAAYLLHELDEQLFEKVFGHKFAALEDKLINTIDKEEHQIIIEDIENNRDKIFEEYKFNKSIIKTTW